MENFNEFSSIEQAAMDQSPSNETDVHHNFVEASGFIDDIENAVDDIGHAVEKTADDVGQATKVIGKAVTPETPEIAETVAAAGGVIKDGVFTKEHADLLKSIDKECSVNELIELRSSLIKANRMA